jgi:hypothetical protein
MIFLLVAIVNIADFSFPILPTPSELSGLTDLWKVRLEFALLRHAQPTMLQLHSKDQQKRVFTFFFAQKL